MKRTRIKGLDVNIGDTLGLELTRGRHFKGTLSNFEPGKVYLSAVNRVYGDSTSQQVPDQEINRRRIKEVYAL